MDKNEMKHGTVIRLNSIKDFDIKLESAKEKNWKIKGILKTKEFEELDEYMQNMIIDYIINMKA